MKTFINVLYRRILYKIPLKFLLVLLAVVAVFIATTKANAGLELVSTFYASSNGNVVSYDSPDGVDMTCIKYDYLKPNCQGIQFKFIDDSRPTLLIKNQNNVVSDIGGIGYCTTGGYVKRVSYLTYDCGLYYYNYKFTNYTSLECQTEYSLIPVSSVDQNYCTTNNLCPSSECPVCPVGTGGISNVYINDILHVGAPFIFIDIPEEISWDYGYTQGGTNMLVNVEGYNVDYDYINGVVDVQSYKPDSEDLTNIVKTVLPLFVPGLCIILLLYFIFKFIKKIF